MLKGGHNGPDDNACIKKEDLSAVDPDQTPILEFDKLWCCTDSSTSLTTKISLDPYNKMTDKTDIDTCM